MGKSKSLAGSASDPLDYPSWLRRAWNFVEKCRRLPDRISVEQIIKPPATKRELERSLSGVERPLPRSLARWFREGSAHCELSYHWSPESRRLSPLQRRAIFQFSVGGQVKIGPLTDIGFWFEMCGIWSESLTSQTDRRSQRALSLWQNSFPFCTFGDGDMLGVLPSDEGPEPVTYLCHDEPQDSFLVAPDFDEFLRRWEQLRYCDQNGLCFFRGKSGLDPKSKTAQQLRAWLPAI